MGEKTYIDWRGTDEGLLASFKAMTTLTTYYGGSTFNPVQQVGLEVFPDYEIDVEPISEEDRRSLDNIKGE